jgi:hypothetical protein
MQIIYSVYHEMSMIAIITQCDEQNMDIPSDL